MSHSQTSQVITRISSGARNTPDLRHPIGFSRLRVPAGTNMYQRTATLPEMLGFRARRRRRKKIPVSEQQPLIRPASRTKTPAWNRSMDDCATNA
jgi:hypothetical protein